MATLLTCDDVLLTTEEIIRGSFVKMADGSFAKRVVIVTDGDPEDCDDALEVFHTLDRGSYVRVGVNQFALQIMDVT